MGLLITGQPGFESLEVDGDRKYQHWIADHVVILNARKVGVSRTFVDDYDDVIYL